MLGAMSALGMGSLAGGLMGAGSSSVDVPLNVEEEVATAIGLGQWVIVVECHSDAAAARAGVAARSADRLGKPEQVESAC